MSNIRKIDIWSIPVTEHEPFSGAFTCRKPTSMHWKLVIGFQPTLQEELDVVNRWLVIR